MAKPSPTLYKAIYLRADNAYQLAKMNSHTSCTVSLAGLTLPAGESLEEVAQAVSQHFQHHVTIASHSGPTLQMNWARNYPAPET